MISLSVCLCVCVSVCLSVREHISANAGPISSVAVARSSSSGVALRYVLPVLWMKSRLAVMGATPARVGSTQRRRSVTCATGAESDVYEYLLMVVFGTAGILSLNGIHSHF